MSAPYRRLAGRLAARVRGVAIAAGYLGYDAAISPPSPEAWTADYDRGDWDYLEGIDQLPHYGVLAAYAGHFAHSSILDVGCGTGLLRTHLDGVDFDRYVGVDPAQTAVDQAAAKSDARTEFRCGDAFLPDLGLFDIVVCSEVLYSLPGVAGQLDRIRDLIRPDGHLLASNLRHPGDGGLYRLLDARLELVASVELANRGSRGKRRRRVVAYRRVSAALG